LVLLFGESSFSFFGQFRRLSLLLYEKVVVCGSGGEYIETDSDDRQQRLVLPQPHDRNELGRWRHISMAGLLAYGLPKAKFRQLKP
jgi:hypothetical protein